MNCLARYLKRAFGALEGLAQASINDAAEGELGHARSNGRGGLRGNQVPLQRMRHRLEAVVGPELSIDLMDMVPQRMDRDLEGPSDFRRAVPLHKALENFVFALGKSVNRQSMRFHMRLLVFQELSRRLKHALGQRLSLLLGSDVMG